MIRRRIVQILSVVMVLVFVECASVFAVDLKSLPEGPEARTGQQNTTSPQETTTNANEEQSEEQTTKQPTTEQSTQQPTSQAPTEEETVPQKNPTGICNINAGYGKPGSTVNVTVTVTGENLQGFMAKLNYDKEKLSYYACVGAEVSNDNKIFTVPAGNEKKLEFTVTFKISSSAKAGDVYAINADVTHTNGNKIETTPDSVIVEKAEEETTEKPTNPGSSDAVLSDITILGHSFSPDFDSSITKYTLTVPNNVTSLNVSAKAHESHADYEVTGADKLEVGQNIVKVICTAENGNKKTYTFVVTRDNKTEQETESESESQSETQTKEEETTQAVKTDNTKTQKVSGVPMWIVFLLCVLFMAIGFAICYVIFVGFNDAKPTSTFVPRNYDDLDDELDEVEEEFEDFD